MSTLRYDPAHRPGPMGLVHAIRPVPEDESEIPREHREEARSFLTVVVPAKNEAVSLPQLVDEIAQALRSLCDDGDPRRLSGFEIVVVDDAFDRSDPRGLEGLGSRLSRAEGPGAGGRGGPVVGDIRRDPVGAGRLDRDAGRRLAERPGRPGAALGGLARPRRRAGLAGEASGRLVQAGDQPMGEPGAQRTCWASRSATRAVRSGSSPARWHCDCRRSGACIGSSVRSCCARDAGWSRCRSVIGPGRTAGRTTTCGIGRSRWSWICSGSPGCCAGRCDTG